MPHGITKALKDINYIMHGTDSRTTNKNSKSMHHECYCTNIVLTTNFSTLCKPAVNFKQNFKTKSEIKTGETDVLSE